jgi:hypothetical protein
MCNCLYSKIKELEKQAEADRAEIAELMEHKRVGMMIKTVAAAFLMMAVVFLFVLFFISLPDFLAIIKKNL